MMPATVLCVFLKLMTLTNGFVLPGPTLGMTPTPKTSCKYNGRVIPEMEYVSQVPCPYWTCLCFKGKLTACNYANCPTPQCVNPVGRCCPRCHDGPNCYLGKKIIPAGVEVRDGYSICRCVKNNYGFERSALCRPMAMPTTFATTTSMAPPTLVPTTN